MTRHKLAWLVFHCRRHQYGQEPLHAFCFLLRWMWHIWVPHLDLISSISKLLDVYNNLVLWLTTFSALGWNLPKYNTQYSRHGYHIWNLRQHGRLVNHVVVVSNLLYIPFSGRHNLSRDTSHKTCTLEGAFAPQVRFGLTFPHLFIPLSQEETGTVWRKSQFYNPYLQQHSPELNIHNEHVQEGLKIKQCKNSIISSTDTLELLIMFLALDLTEGFHQ